MKKENNIIFGMTLQEYKKRYKKTDKILLEIKKIDVINYDKANRMVGKNILLKKRKWALIGDTYYEIPRNCLCNWFIGLNTGAKIGVCALLGCTVAAAIAVPTAITLNRKTPIIATDINETNASGTYQDDGSFKGNVKSSNNDYIVDSISKVKIGGYEIDKSYYSFDRDSGEIIISNEVFKQHKGGIVVSPKLVTKKLSFQFNKLNVEVGKGKSTIVSIKIADNRIKDVENVEWSLKDEKETKISIVPLNDNVGLRCKIIGNQITDNTTIELVAKVTSKLDHIVTTSSCFINVFGYYNVNWQKDIGAGKLFFQLANEAEKIVIGKTKDYQQIVQGYSSYNIGETDEEDKVVAYVSGDGKNLYVLSDSKIAFNNDDCFKIEGENWEGAIFMNCLKAKEINLENIDTSSMTKALCMFAGCEKLEKIESIESLDVSNVTNFSNMFSDCKKIESIDISKLQIINALESRYMFAGCISLKSIDVSNIDTSKITTMEGMFQNCSALSTLDVTSFNTSNVENLTFMFSNCSGLTSLDVSSFNTSKVYDFGSMFAGCKNLTTLDLSNFDTRNGSGFVSMFYYCINLENIVGLGNFKLKDEPITEVYFDGMFHNCIKLKTIDISGFDTTKVDSVLVGGMFACDEEENDMTTIYATDKFVVNPEQAMFDKNYSLVGEKGTTYLNIPGDCNSSINARIDEGPKSSRPGYFTLKR